MSGSPQPIADEILRIENLSCRYGEQEVLKGVSLQLQQGSLVSLLGPSGCGKSTLLNAVAGFHEVEGGIVRIGGEVASSTEIHLPPERRNTGMIFQDYALFPHLSVLENVCFGLKGVSKSKAVEEAREWLALVRMESFAGRYPHQLSGGQQQRVALARALATRPGLLLMDEPFSNLDTDLRRALVREVSEMLREIGITAILVTHDQEEAFIFGDQVGLMREGEMQQWGTPTELYAHPKNRWVADFVGRGSWLSGVIEETGHLKTAIGSFALDGEDGLQGTCFEVLLRPHEIDLKSGVKSEEGPLGKVIHCEFTGQASRYLVEIHGSERVEVSMDGLETFKEGDQVTLSVARPRPVFFRVE